MVSRVCRFRASAALLSSILLIPACLEESESPVLRLEAPTALSGTAASDGLSVFLAWIDNSKGESGFRIDASPVAISEDSDVTEWITAPADSSAYAFPALPGTTRYFRVRAVTSTHQSAPSNLVSVVMPSVPLPPQHLTALALGPVGIELQWVNDGVSLGNRIERSSDGGVSWALVMDFATGSGPYGFREESSLTASTTYHYRVRASNAGGPGAWAHTVTTTQTNAAFFPDLAGANSANITGIHTSIDVSPSGVDHISHYDLSAGVLLYTAGAIGGSYATSIIDNGSDIPSGPLSPGYHGTAIVADAAGRIKVVAGNYHTDHRMRYIRNTSGPLVRSNLDLVGGYRPKLLVAPFGAVLNVIYRSPITGGVMHAESGDDGSSWAITAATPQIGPDVVPALLLDSDGIPHVFISTGNGLYHYWKGSDPSGQWLTESAPVVAGGYQDHISAARGPTDAFFVAYRDVATGQLRLASNLSGAWDVEIVHAHTRGNLGLFNSIAVDPSNSRIHIAYWNMVQRDLWYAWRDPGGLWTRTLLDSNGDVGQYASLALHGGKAHVAYFDAFNGNVKLCIYSQ